MTISLCKRWLSASLAIIVLFLSVSRAASAELDSQTFRRCWQFSVAEATQFAPAALDNLVYVPLGEGTLIALDSEQGQVIWRANLGGEIVSSPLATKNAVIIASQTTATTDGEQIQTTTIRALSPATGITLWQYNARQTAQAALALQENSLLLAYKPKAGNQKLVKLSAVSGETAWTKEFASAFSSPVSVSSSLVYFLTSDGFLHVLKLSDGETTNRLRLKSPVRGELIATKDFVIFSDAAGNVSALRQSDSQILWNLRAGGAIQDILLTPRGVVVSSLDNFVYLHDAIKGTRKWRRRLAGRPISATQFNSDSIFLLTNGESNALLLQLKNGKVFNQLPLGAENYAVAQPVFTKQRIIVPTMQAIIAFGSTESVSCQEASAAAKKKDSKK